eukprot:UN10823
MFREKCVAEEFLRCWAKICYLFSGDCFRLKCPQDSWSAYNCFFDLGFLHVSSTITKAKT